MTSEQIIDKIIAAKTQTGLTNQQLSELSGVPKSTVDKILRKETANPSLQNILDLAHAVGYDHAHVDTSPMNDPTVQHLLALYNKQDAQKSRTIRVLAIALAVVVLLIFALFIYDFAHMDRGWIQTAYIGNTAESALQWAPNLFFKF